jgi:hypothetical protein
MVNNFSNIKTERTITCTHQTRERRRHMQEDFEDTKGVIRILKSNKDRQREPPTIGKQLVNFIT